MYYDEDRVPFDEEEPQNKEQSKEKQNEGTPANES